MNPDTIHYRQAKVDVVFKGRLCYKVHLSRSNSSVLANFEKDNHDASDKVEEAKNNTLRRFVPVVTFSLMLWVLHSLQLVISVYAEKSHAVPNHKHDELTYFELGP